MMRIVCYWLAMLPLGACLTCNKLASLDETASLNYKSKCLFTMVTLYVKWETTYFNNIQFEVCKAQKYCRVCPNTP